MEWARPSGVISTTTIYSSVSLDLLAFRLLPISGNSYTSWQHDDEFLGYSRGFSYGRASRIILNGVSAARRIRVNPPFERTSLKRASPACAPRARPTSWLSEPGVHIIVENP